MIMYTLMPPELVFPASDDDFAKQTVVNINGVKVVIQPHSQHQWQIVRLLSSNPSDFLNEKFQPGQLIDIKPFFGS